MIDSISTSVLIVELNGSARSVLNDGDVVFLPHVTKGSLCLALQSISCAILRGWY